MTKQDFIAICNEHTIDPQIALEDRGVIEILNKRVETIYQDTMQQIELSTYLSKNF